MHAELVAPVAVSKSMPLPVPIDVPRGDGGEGGGGGGGASIGQRQVGPVETVPEPWCNVQAPIDKGDQRDREAANF